MAITGTITGTTSNQYIAAKIDYSYTQDTEKNTSTITATLYFRRTNTGYTTSGTGTFYIAIDGSVQTINKYMNIGTGWANAGSITKTILHKDDGTKSVSISASGTMPDTTLKATSCSDTVELNTIPRASTIAVASNKTLGNYCNVIWIPLSASFRYKLKFTLGGWTDTTGPIHPNKTTDYIYTGYQLPLDVAEQFPGDTYGTMTVTLYTYSDSGATTQVGSASSKTFIVTIPNNSTTQPTVTMSLAPVHSLGSKFASVYVQGKSKARATLSATGKYNATINANLYKMVALGKTDGASPYETDILTNSGTVTINGYATDSRGFTGSTTKNITVIPYSKPKIIPASGENSIICARCDNNGNLSDEGTYLKIKAKRSYSKVESGTQLNYCAIRYRCKPATNASFTDSDWVTILAKNSTSDEVTTAPIANVVSNTSISYIVEVGVVDDVGESSSLRVTVPTLSVTFHLRDGGNGAAFGKYAEKEKCLEISPDWTVKILGGLEVGGISAYVVEQGESGIWSYRKWSNGFAECWGSTSADRTLDKAWGSLYVCDRISAILYPFEFIKRPTEIATIRSDSIGCWLIAESSGYGLNSATQSGSYSAARATSVGSSEKLYIDFIVRGRWK